MENYKITATKLINLLFVKTDNFSNHSSYYLKHIIENSAQVLGLPCAYLSNDAFKLLMIELGFINKKFNENDDCYNLKLVRRYNQYSKLRDIENEINQSINIINSKYCEKYINKTNKKLMKNEIYQTFKVYYDEKFKN